MSTYPEHDKLKGLNGDNQIVGNFIEWLGENGYVIARYDEYDRLFPIHTGRDQLIADHFEIDQNKLEAEKVHMLSVIRGEVVE